MKTSFVFHKISLKGKSKDVRKEVERIFAEALDAWLVVVINASGGQPFSGESTGSLIPVSRLIQKLGIQTFTDLMIEDKLARAQIQRYRDWFAYRDKTWRFHLTKSGYQTDLIKTPELGAKTQAPYVKYDKAFNSGLQKFSFEPQIFQFLANEKVGNISKTSPWNSLEKGRVAYAAKVKELMKSSQFKDLFQIQRKK